MADPSDPTQQTPEELRELIDAERACPAPPPEALDRVLLRLTASIDGGVAPAPHVARSSGAGAERPAPGAAAHAIARAPGRLTRLARAGTIFVAGAAAGVGADRSALRLAHRPSPAPLAAGRAAPLDVAPPPTPAPAATTRPETLAPPPEGVALKPLPSPPSRKRETGDSDEAAGRDGRLAAERNLLEIARTALSRGQVDDALGSLRRHARLFPDGDLQEEREGLLIQALVRQGEYPQAREKAAQFVRRYPRSLFAPSVGEALRAIP